MQPLTNDLSGKTVLVTGASTGIGKEIARSLAAQRATVVIAGRHRERLEAAKQEIGGKIEVMTVDLSSQASVREFAAAFRKSHPKLHVLVNNAGGWTTSHQKSADGIEYTWATNVLGYHLLTELLLDLLKSSAPAR